MRQKGLTLIELMIILAIVGIFAALVLPVATQPDFWKRTTFTPGGVVTEQCISGYKFVIGMRGRATQVLDEFGKGVKCQ